MGFKGLLLIVFLFVLLIPIAFAEEVFTEYIITGTGGDFQTGQGIFSSTTGFEILGTGVSNQTQVPSVLDLNNDGTNEILIIDGSSFRVFNIIDDDLNGTTSRTTGLSGRTSNYIVFDIDGDGTREIIVAGEETELIVILSMNGSTLILENTIDYSSFFDHTDGQVMIQCEDQNKCLIVVSETISGAAQDNLSVASFNSTDIVNVLFLEESTGNGLWCTPRIKNIEVANLDGVGTDKQFIFSMFDMGNIAFTDEEIQIFGITLDDNLVPSQAFTSIVISSAQDESIFPFGCEERAVGNQFSAPLVFPATQSSDSQIFIAFQNKIDEFRINYYNSDASFNRKFPRLFNAEGNLISNLFRGTFFPRGQANKDFCAMGYDNDETLLVLLCASPSTTESPKSNIYRINVTDQFVVNPSIGTYHVIAHSTNHDQEESPCLDDSACFTDLDEVLSPYGIHKLDRGERELNLFGCDVAGGEFGGCNLVEQFSTVDQLRNESGTYISVDISFDGSEDLIFTTIDTMFVLDSLFRDQPAEIDIPSIRINPCLDQGDIQINTSMSISFSVSDTDPVDDKLKDPVFAQVGAYVGSANEQFSEVKGSKPSGASFFFPAGTFALNKTVGFGVSKIRLLGNDTGSGLPPDIVDFDFSVGETGVEFGDCVTIGVVDVPDVDFNVSDEAAANRGIIKGLEEASDLFSVSVLIVWLVLMIALAIAILTGMSSASGTTKVVGLAIAEIFMLVIGTILGIIPIGILLVIVILGLVVLGLQFRKMAISDEGMT